MAKKRAKRFDEGGDVGIYDYASLGKRAPKASEKKDSDYAYDAISEITGQAEIDKAKPASAKKEDKPFSNWKADDYVAPTATQEASEPTSFKQAFAEARKAGDKNFTYEGKKYTTELKTKAPAVKDEDEASAEARMNKIGEDYKKSKQPAPAAKKEYKLNDASATTKQLVQEKIDKYGKINDVIDSAALGLLSGRGKAIKEVGKRIEPYIPSAARDLARQGGKRMDDLRTIFDDGIPKLANRAKQLGTEALKLSRFKHGGSVKASKMGSVKTAKPKMTSASSRGDGIAQRGKTKGRIC